MGSTDIQQVTVGVPASRLADFYEMFGRWLRAGTELPALVSSAPAAALKEFSDASAASIAEWWTTLSEPAKRVFIFLANQPEKRFDGVELAVACKIAKGPAAVAGTLSWPGKHAERLGMRFPLGWDRGEQRYWMSRGVANAIKEARRAAAAS